VTVSCTSTEPQRKGRFLAAILISASGPQDRDVKIVKYRVFLIPGDIPRRQGIAVLRLEDRDGFRPPTVAESEYSCRAGSTLPYTTGEDPEALATVGNISAGSFRDTFPAYGDINAGLKLSRITKQQRAITDICFARPEQSGM
jgi:hypothetical protein